MMGQVAVKMVAGARMVPMLTVSVVAVAVLAAGVAMPSAASEARSVRGLRVRAAVMLQVCSAEGASGRARFLRSLRQQVLPSRRLCRVLRATAQVFGGLCLSPGRM